MDERQRWNARYAGRVDLVAGEPNPFLQEHLALLPQSHALELAMGEGHEAIFLAQRGFSSPALISRRSLWLGLCRWRDGLA